MKIGWKLQFLLNTIAAAIGAYIARCTLGVP